MLLRLDYVETLRLVSPVLQKDLHIVFARKLNNKAVGIVRVTEIGSPTYTRGHAHWKLTDLQSVQTEMTFARVTYRRAVPISIPMFRVFIARLVFVRGDGPVNGPLFAFRRSLCGTVGVVSSEVTGASSVRTSI